MTQLSSTFPFILFRESQAPAQDYDVNMSGEFSSAHSLNKSFKLDGSAYISILLVLHIIILKLLILSSIKC